MQRRSFLIRTGGVALAFTAGFGHALTPRKIDERVGMGSLILRNRFEQTRPDKSVPLVNPLTLLEVPAYYRKRFGVSLLEFSSNHFQSLDAAYLQELRGRIKASKAELINVQVDEDYDLASVDEAVRQKSLLTVRAWIEAAATLGSRAIRINPGKPRGSVEQSMASLKELNQLCRAKGLPLLTENHFGIEMDPAVHLRIREGAGPDNVYTLPDFGNYPLDSMWDSLAKILPYAYVVSAKAVDFDAQGNHVTFDFERCIKMCEQAGFTGIYLVEQWSRKPQPLDAEKIADWMLERVYRNLVVRA